MTAHRKNFRKFFLRESAFFTLMAHFGGIIAVMKKLIAIIKAVGRILADKLLTTINAVVTPIVAAFSAVGKPVVAVFFAVFLTMILGIAVVGILPINTAQAGFHDGETKIFKGMNTVFVYVPQVLGKCSKLEGYEIAIKNAVELKLRQNGLKVGLPKGIEQNASRLRIQLLSSDIASIAACYGVIRFSLDKPAKLFDRDIFIGNAIIWERSYTWHSGYPSVKSQNKEGVNELTDIFLNSYFQANPRPSSESELSLPGCFNIIRSKPEQIVRVNGVRMTLLIDTGASTTQLTKQQARAAGVQPTGEAEFTLADGSIVTNKTGSANISLGGGLTGDFPVSIGGGKGLLGRDVLDQFACR